MKIAVLSDIHGNLPALEAALSEINRIGVDQIIVLGDLITDFSQHTNEILHIVRNATQNVIRGNRESYLINQANNPSDDTWKKYKQFYAFLETFKKLSDADIAYLKALPQQMAFKYGENFCLRAVHGSPFSEFDAIYADSFDLIERSFGAIDENVLLCGHAHRPFVYSNGKKTIVNAGSVGLNFDKSQSADFAVIRYDGGDFDVDIRKAKYDYAAFKMSCDCDDPWVWLCLKSIESGKSGESYVLRFLDEAKRRYGVSPLPDDDYYELFNEWRKKGIV